MIFLMFDRILCFSKSALLNIGLVVAASAAALLACEITARMLCGNVLVEKTQMAGFTFTDRFNSLGYKRGLAERLQVPEMLDYISIQNTVVLEPFRFRSQGDPGAISQLRRKRLALLLGDSVLYGGDLRADAAMAALLQSRMPGWDIINLGVPGFNIYQIHSFFTHFYPVIKPAVVVYVLCANDILPAALVRRGRHTELLYPNYLLGLSETGRLRLRPCLPPSLRELLMKSSLYKLWLFSSVPRNFNVPDEKLWDMLAVLVADMDRRCRQDGVPLVVFQPVNTALPEYISPYKALARTHVFFQKLPLAPRYFLPDGIHLTPDGHREAAARLRDILLRVVPGSRKSASQSGGSRHHIGLDRQMG
jgi:lysophospholipase L1-like esterase